MGVHGQLEGCNRKMRPKAAVANVFHDKDGPFIPHTVCANNQLFAHIYVQITAT